MKTGPHVPWPRLRLILVALTVIVAGSLVGAGGSTEAQTATGTWCSAASMATAVYPPTATLLPSGKVLVVGGNNANGSAISDLYDPSTNTWSTAGSMVTAIFGAVATLLPNGKVLVVGGDSPIPDTNSAANAELYDPSTNTWSLAGSMPTGRADATATLLQNGEVLVAGGSSSNANGAYALASAELYDPSTNTWSQTGSMATARYTGHTATLLPSGKVLVVGGVNETYTAYLASAELYNPYSGTWSSAGSMSTVRGDHTATLLPSGKVLVAGGYGYNGITLTSAELYDPSTNTWSQTGSMATGRAVHTATLLPNGKVLVAGGYSGSGYLASAELYDPVGGACVPGEPITGLAATPGDNAGDVTLTWTAPSPPPSGETYQLRYSSVPIDQNSWASAMPLLSGPVSPLALTKAELYTNGLTLGTQLYFAIGTVGGAGNLLSLSNVASIQDIGFRPNHDGYYASNSHWTPSFQTSDFTWDDVVEMFPTYPVNLSVGGKSLPNPIVQLWFNAVQASLSGHCGGMAATSLGLFEHVALRDGVTKPNDLNKDVSQTYDRKLLDEPNTDQTYTRRFIAYYQAEQTSIPLNSYGLSARQGTPSKVLQDLRSAMSSGSPNRQMVINITASPGGNVDGHFLVPYAIQQLKDGSYGISVYDPNWPYWTGKSIRQVIINPAAETWTYLMDDRPSPPLVWGTQENGGQIAVIPLTEYITQPTSPANLPTAGSTVKSMEVRITGARDLLVSVKNYVGQVIGNVGGQFVNQIPNAFPNPLGGWDGTNPVPIYDLPLGGDYTISLDGQNLPAPEAAISYQFGPGYALSVGSTLQPGDQDSLTVASDGTLASYQAKTAKKVTFDLVVQSTSETYEFKVSNINVGSSQTVKVSNDQTDGRLVIDDSKASGGSYGLEITRINSSGEQEFLQTSIPISQGETEYLDYRDWTGPGPMALLGDLGSDGTTDQTTVLANQAYQPPVLTVPGDQHVQYSDPLSFTVSAADPQDQASSLRFSAKSLPAGLTLTDNLNGTATASGTITVPAGTYTAQITVTNPQGLTDTKPVTIIVSKEDAQIAYTGDTLVRTGPPVTLSATVTEPSDGSPGDITKSAVFFDLAARIAGGTKSYGPVSPDATGKATFALPSGLPADIYDVTVHMDPNNGYYQAQPTAPSTLAVYDPSAGFITGGGWVMDGGQKAQLSFDAKYVGTQDDLQGQLTYDYAAASGVTNVVSGPLQWLVVKGHTAVLRGKAAVNGTANCTFEMTVVDNSDVGKPSTFSIKVWQPDGTLLHSLAAMALGGGNIVVAHPSNGPAPTATETANAGSLTAPLAPTVTVLPSVTPASTAMAITATSTASPTRTTASSSPTATGTLVPTPTATQTPMGSNTPTGNPVATSVPTRTPSPSATPTSADSKTPTASQTPAGRRGGQAH